MIAITNLNLENMGDNPMMASLNGNTATDQGEENMSMTSFARVDYPTQHPGLIRAERIAGNVSELIRHVDPSRSSASLLLAGFVAALMVVTNQVVETWTEGHLLAAWIVMWTVAFAALALLAWPAKRAAAGLRDFFKTWAAARRQAAQDQQLWDLALTDARVMADISRAMSAAAVRESRRAPWLPVLMSAS
jgi:hypothetical protein